MNEKEIVYRNSKGELITRVPPDNRALTELEVRFYDFLERYERDVKTAALSREDILRRLDVHCQFINKLSPVYERLCWLFAAIALGTVAIGVTAFWQHVSWK